MMETIRVNMTPCEDIKTIHASQNDNEAREWGFELHNNGDVIDASEISDQLVFKAYEGGTEELLPSSLMNGSVDLGSLAWTYMPNNYFRSTSVISDAKIPSNENTVANIFCSILKPNTANNVYANNEGIAIDGTGRIRIYYDDMPTDAVSFAQAMQGVLLWYEKNDSTPTTAPFLGDIKYPQGLLMNQQFTYRESPTEEDGLANIVGIKGQTLKWNQTVQVSNIVATKTVNGVTFTNNSDGTVTMSGTANNLVATPIATGVTLEQNHVYYLGKGSTWSFMNGYGADGYGLIKHNRANASVIYAYIQVNNTVNETVSVQCIDFTKLFGETKANEIFAMGDDGIAYFKSFFPLDYYPYNSGSLIPFMGNGIKTTPNIANVEYEQGAISSSVAGKPYESNKASDTTRIRVKNLIYNEDGKTYILYFNSSLFDAVIQPYDSNSLSAPLVTPYDSWKTTSPIVFTATGSVAVAFRYKTSATITADAISQIKPNMYKEGDESVINLPISTYFPTGMKDVPDYTNGGTIYDEMTSNRADTRVGSVDLGTLDWTTYSSPERHVFRAYILSNMKQPNGANLPNAMCSRYEPMAYNPISANDDGYFAIGAQRIVIIEHDYTDPVAFKESLSNVYLYYELATPTETSFTTASLVTENAEIPLSNEDGALIGKCTEQLSSESGFFDAKIKLADDDGECYSNKIQLHIERSPQ